MAILDLHPSRKPPNNGNFLLLLAVHDIDAADLNSFNEFVENLRRELRDV